MPNTKDVIYGVNFWIFFFSFKKNKVVALDILSVKLMFRLDLYEWIRYIVYVVVFFLRQIENNERKKNCI